MSFRCSTCNQIHDSIPLSFAADFPDKYANLSEADREARALCSSDQCIIDDDFFAVRGLIEIPVIGQEEPFMWGAWATVVPQNFEEIQDSWTEEGRERTRGPYRGRIANKLSQGLEALNLKCTIQLREVGSRPLFFIDEPHLLATQQLQGISQHDAYELGKSLLAEFEGS